MKSISEFMCEDSNRIFGLHHKTDPDARRQGYLERCGLKEVEHKTYRIIVGGLVKNRDGRERYINHMKLEMMGG